MSKPTAWTARAKLLAELVAFEREILAAHPKARLCVRSEPGFESFLEDFKLVRRPARTHLNAQGHPVRVRADEYMTRPKALPDIIIDQRLRLEIEPTIKAMSVWVDGEDFSSLLASLQRARSWDRDEARGSGCPVALRSEWQVILNARSVGFRKTRPGCRGTTRRRTVSDFVVTYAWPESWEAPSGRTHKLLKCDPLGGYPASVDLEDGPADDLTLFQTDSRVTAIRRRYVYALAVDRNRRLVRRGYLQEEVEEIREKMRSTAARLGSEFQQH